MASFKAWFPVFQSFNRFASFKPFKTIKIGVSQ
jgi:hypothetical protein